MTRSGDAEISALLDQVRQVDWAAWAIPYPSRIFDYRPEDVVPAFEALAWAQTDKAARRAYHLILYAVGHDHSGTPYAAMVPATDLLARLIPLLGDSAPIALDALVDCVGWSQAEPAFLGPDGRLHNPGKETLEHALMLRPLLEQWASSEDPNRRRPAADLLEMAADANQ